MRSVSPIRGVSPVRSSRSLSQPEDAASTTTLPSQDLSRLRQQLADLEADCRRAEQEVQREEAEREAAGHRAVQELRAAHEVQLEELEHFRRLVQEKRQVSSAAAHA